LSTQAIPATVLVVDACADTDAVLADRSLERARIEVERSSDAAAAIQRVEDGDAVDAVVLAPNLDDPVRVAQRLLSLDRQGAVVILAGLDREAEVRHALDVAPFLDGDVVLASTSDPAAAALLLAEAAARTRVRRKEGAERRQQRDTPPPLSARYLGTLLDSAPIGIVTLEGDGAVIGWNRRAGEMLGVPEVEALGTRFEELWAEEDRPRLASLIESFGSAGLDRAGEVFELGERAFELTGARFGTRSGEPGRLLVLQDVSSRIAAERELMLQKALLEAQAESSIAGIAVVSRDGRLERINHRWAEIWGIDEQTIRGDRKLATRKTLEQVEDPDAFMAGVEQLAANPGSDFKDEVRLLDGRTIERYGAHARTDDGEIVGRVWFHTDISERKREEDSLRFLADATNLLSSSLDHETTLRRLAQLAVPRIADWCAVEVGEPGRAHRVAVAHVDPDKVEFARVLRERYPEDAEHGAVPNVMRTGEPQIYPEIPAGALEGAAQDEEHLELLRALQLRSVMIVPIQIRGNVFGAITFVTAESGHTYGDDDLRLAEELARRAAIAIDNSRVHAELRQTARTLQESLLPPHLPAIENVELAARFRPAGAGMEVGGDFYDIFETRPDRWGIAVGDVCGKGAEAAALTALTRYTARAAAMYEESARGVLGVLNKALLHQRGDFRFTTLAYCVLDMAAAPPSLKTSSGGHPRPLLLHGDGTAGPVGAAGPLLGVVPDAGFEEEEVLLATGDAIVLYTDGLTDAHAPERMLDESDLLTELGRCAGLSADEIAVRMEQLALGDSDQAPRDDIAILVVKLGG
jgi:PAS domain S-box-containing protein